MTRDRDTLVAAFDVADELAEFRLGLSERQRLHGASGVVIFLTNNTSAGRTGLPSGSVAELCAEPAG